jgi:uncharacterized membrane protein
MMRVLSDKYPNTIILCFIWSIIGLILILLNINDAIRIVIALPMILFIPGYLVVFALFPSKKTEKGIDDVERIALSFGLSIAIVPLIGLILNYTVWGIKLLPIVFSLELLIFTVGGIAAYRWFHTPLEDRYRLNINVSLPKQETKVDKVLTTALIICIIIAASVVVFVILTPKQGEHFTEFYILGSNHLASDYPENLTLGENATVILGIVNHENTVMNYAIEVWLSNQTTVYNTTSNMNETIYHHVWFMDKINTTLIPEPINLENFSESQWEYNYTFHINRLGHYKLIFLLYTNQTQNYIKNQDYKTVATEKVDEDHTTAYRSVYLWINVT